MIFYFYSLEFSAEEHDFIFKEEEVMGKFNEYYNTVEIRGTSYPINKVLIAKPDMMSIIFITDSKPKGSIKDFLVTSYCREIDDTISVLSSVRGIIKGV